MGKVEKKTGEQSGSNAQGANKPEKEKVGGSAQGVKRPEQKPQERKAEIIKLVVLLIIVITVPLFFVGAVAGWFDGDKRVVIDAGEYCEGCGEQMVDISGEEYEQIVKDGRSFVVFVDQPDCTTADKLEGFVHNYADEKDLRVYRIQFSEAKETSMHEKVKYYPSVVVVSRGNIAGFLRADSDEDARAYNDEGEFRGWVEKIVR